MEVMLKEEKLDVTIRLLMQRTDQVCIEQAEKRWLLKPWLPSPCTPQCPQPGSLPWRGRREEEEGRRESRSFHPWSWALPWTPAWEQGMEHKGQHHPARAGEIWEEMPVHTQKKGSVLSSWGCLSLLFMVLFEIPSLKKWFSKRQVSWENKTIISKTFFFCGGKMDTQRLSGRTFGNFHEMGF